jgi:maltooligosyltrehalose trehalohydrolase
MADKSNRQLPAGADIVPGQGVHFRVWAPDRKSVEVMLPGEVTRFIPLHREPNDGYFSALIPGATAGTQYKYRLDGAHSYPDVASRYQPAGPHHNSEVIDPSAFTWSDAAWPGVQLAGQVIYEMHIGAFTPEGTWAAAAEHLNSLKELGITLLEIMPVNEFPGQFGWGYDGVHPFAPTRLYGTPDDFRRFVDRAHSLGLGVILDVVYNHLGPDGNYFGAFSRHYFTHKHGTDWGDAINFDGEKSGPVRDLFIANAAYWIREFHLDGLRLDATQNIYDQSADHILAAIAREVRMQSNGRGTILIAENEPQDAKLVRPPEQGGYGLDALWNDDLHHTAMVRLTGHNDSYYSDYLGTPQEFISAAKYGSLYQGQRSRHRGRRRGTSSRGVSPRAFVNFLQNHDQVANTPRGERAHLLTSPGIHRAMTALILLLPGTPMLFQGEEFAASSPFFYFADQREDLRESIREGRRGFLATPELLADPCDPATFEKSKLDHTEREQGRHAEMWHLIHDVLQLRPKDPSAPEGAVLSADAFVLRYFSDDLLIIVNFGLDLPLHPAPEPLLAPPADCEWEVVWSTEAPKYGGRGVLRSDPNWIAPGHATIVLKPCGGAEPARPTRRPTSQT